ncbi:Gfo/Idh/MocA family protein [Aneurinibacillus sp. REN35]|uniref:Gfo/Idh/MocA family protein n=1 Tax=Aneurinibacillus sp. REN35 TaxID=3237286 RepID=UPI003526DDA7
MSQVIVIGAGNWGRNLVRTFYDLGALASVVEEDEVTRQQLHEVYPEIHFYPNVQVALLDDAPAVVVATPAPTHFYITKAALLAGKDVFVEKPLTLCSQEAQELVDLAEKQERLLMVGHLLLYQPAIRKIKEAIEDGLIGSLQGLHQERLKLGRIRSVENVLWSFGVHDIAVLLYLTDEQPASIQVTGQPIVQSTIEDDVYLHLYFKSGVQAHLHTSWYWPEIRRHLVVTGSEGMLVYDEEQQTVVLHRKAINTDLSNKEEGSVLLYRGEAKPLTLECQHFLTCVQERQRPFSDGNNGLNVIRILEEASRMLRRERI